MKPARYAVREIFSTLQGEGARAGSRAIFVRLAGCNLWSGRPEDRAKGRGVCARWCDTDFFRGEPMTADEIAGGAARRWGPSRSSESASLKWAVITGGEPMLQLDLVLVRALRARGFAVAVETNGSQDPEDGGERVLGAVDWITVSPKKGAPLELRQADEVKVVLPGAVRGEAGWTDLELSDLAERIAADHYFVQPQDVVYDGALGDTLLHPAQAHGAGAARDAGMVFQENLGACIKFVSENPLWRLGLQLHKYARLP